MGEGTLELGLVTELGSLGVRDSNLNRKLRIAEESGGGFELGTHKNDKRCRPLCYGASPSLPSGHFCLFIVLSFIHPDCSSFSLRDRDRLIELVGRIRVMTEE